MVFPLASADAYVSVFDIRSKKSDDTFLLEKLLLLALLLGLATIFPLASADANVSALDIRLKKELEVFFLFGLFLL